jgi:hypothetical protein
MIFLGFPQPSPSLRGALPLPVAESTLLGTVTSVDPRSPDFMTFTLQTMSGAQWTVTYDSTQGVSPVARGDLATVLGTPTSGDTFNAYWVFARMVYRMNPPTPIKAPPSPGPIPYRGRF